MAQDERKIKVREDARCFMGHSITPAGSGDGDVGGSRLSLSSVTVLSVAVTMCTQHWSAPHWVYWEVNGFNHSFTDTGGSKAVQSSFDLEEN